MGPRPVTPWTGGIVKQEPWPYGTRRSLSSSGSLISSTNVFLNGAFKADLCMGQTEHVHVSLHWVRVCIPPRVQVSKLDQEASVSFRTSQAYRSTVRLPYVIRAAGAMVTSSLDSGWLGSPSFPACLSTDGYCLQVQCPLSARLLGQIEWHIFCRYHSKDFHFSKAWVQFGFPVKHMYVTSIFL